MPVLGGEDVLTQTDAAGGDLHHLVVLDEFYGPIFHRLRRINGGEPNGVNGILFSKLAGKVFIYLTGGPHWTAWVNLIDILK